MGSTRVLARRCAATSRTTAGACRHTRTLLDALDAATPLNLRPTWRSRFPTLY